MRLKNYIMRTLSVAAFASGISYGAVLFDSGIDALANIDPTQLGRLSRSGVISDWSTQKLFPGVINPNTSYHYTTYDVPDVNYTYIQITFDDVSGQALTFASAYFNAYLPNSSSPNRGLDTNYLGDEGASGNFFGTDPRVFQVAVTTPSDVIVVVNDSSATGAGIGQPYHVIVEGFVDTQFDDVAPEPASAVLSGSGLLAGLAVMVWRKRSALGKS